MKAKPINQIREEGIAVLTESLGPVDATRFLQQFDSGSGDYTAERGRILGDPSVDDVVKKIRLMRRGKRRNPPST